MSKLYYDKILLLCNQRGITMNKLCTDIGISKSSASQWKKGTNISAKNLKKIADYFDVSMGYFDQEKKGVDTQLTKCNLKFALFGTTSVSDEELDNVKRYARYIRDLKLKQVKK